MSYKIFTLLIVVTLCVSCAEPTAPPRNNGIHRIVYATGGCFGTCPVQLFSMDSSLVLNYTGYRYTKDQGDFRGTIDAATWNELNRKLESIKYLDMDTSWAPNTVDASSFEIWIYHSNGIKKIHSNNYRDFPDSVLQVFDWIETVAVNQAKSPSGKIEYEPLVVVPPPPPVPDTSFQFTEPD